MYPDEVSHLRVHLLAVKELEGQITIIGLVVIGGLHLHVVEVDLSFSNTCGQNNRLLVLLF